MSLKRGMCVPDSSNRLLGDVDETEEFCPCLVDEPGGLIVADCQSAGRNDCYLSDCRPYSTE